MIAAANRPTHGGRPDARPSAAFYFRREAAPARTQMDLTLTRGEVSEISAFIDNDVDRDDDVVRLLLGDGHSGYGLYAAHPEYPEEGAILIKNLPAPAGVVACAPGALRCGKTMTQDCVQHGCRHARENAPDGVKGPQHG